MSPSPAEVLKMSPTPRVENEDVGMEIVRLAEPRARRLKTLLFQVK